MKSAVIILNYNSAPDTIGLAADLSVNLPDTFNIIIVDNDSDDCKMLVEFANAHGGIILNEEQCVSQKSITRITLIKKPKNLGYASGNNTGLRLALQSGHTTAFVVNPDVIVESYELFAILGKCLEQNPKVAVAGPHIRTPRGYQSPGVRPDFIFVMNNFLFPIPYILGIIRNYFCLQRRTWFRAYYGIGCFLALDLKKLCEVGFFDENTFLYFEEAILAEKLRKRMYIFAYHPYLSILHNHEFTASWHLDNPYLEASREYYQTTYLNPSWLTSRFVGVSLRYKNWLFNILGRIRYRIFR